MKEDHRNQGGDATNQTCRGADANDVAYVLDRSIRCRRRPGTDPIGLRFSAVAFYIRKTANGRTVWLERVGPAMIWGPKDQALKFMAIGLARMALRSVAKTDQAEIEIDDDDTQKP